MPLRRDSDAIYLMENARREPAAASVGLTAHARVDRTSDHCCKNLVTIVKKSKILLCS